jgi:hypothetical protein
MQFFTPDLYLRFNSPDDDDADRADEAWETAIRAYQAHLASLRDRTPSPVRKLADLCLHDAELLGRDQAIEPFFTFPGEPFGPFPMWSAVGILSVKQDDTIVSLLYALWDRIRDYPASENWPFSPLRPHWLYDEIDVAPHSRGMFLHRILFSDGGVIEVPFVSVVIHRVPLPGAGGESKQSA